MPGMHHQSRRFVHHQHITVLVHDVKGDVFGHNLEIISRPVHHHRHHVVGLDLVAGFDRSAVHQHAAGVRGLLHPVARSALQPIGQEFIDTDHLLALVGHETEVLIKFTAVGIDVIGAGFHLSFGHHGIRKHFLYLVLIQYPVCFFRSTALLLPFLFLIPETRPAPRIRGWPKPPLRPRMHPPRDMPQGCLHIY